MSVSATDSRRVRQSGNEKFGVIPMEGGDGEGGGLGGGGVDDDDADDMLRTEYFGTYF